MYHVEIRPGIKVSCERPEEVLALVEILVDAQKERERRERRERRRAPQSAGRMTHGDDGPKRGAEAG